MIYYSKKFKGKEKGILSEVQRKLSRVLSLQSHTGCVHQCVVTVYLKYKPANSLRFLLGADHTEVPTAWHIPPRKKTSTFIINYTVCTLWAQRASFISGMMETLLKSKIPDTGQGLTLGAGLSKDSSQAFFMNSSAQQFICMTCPLQPFLFVYYSKTDLLKRSIQHPSTGSLYK